ncbi:hypothetical protein RclHR1_22940004 [Rhizophagus clarus]|uniref:Uncharacterized protein n=1 Tax=Rhizophagus clarus TaxID=94130 RepID=A0A2Z6QVX0_9GLOM|nr:hypothetical protein RclHR1_22940004 [Rhizophagus clarus]
MNNYRIYYLYINFFIIYYYYIITQRSHNRSQSHSRSRSPGYRPRSRNSHHRSHYVPNDQMIILSSSDSSPQNRGRSLTKRTSSHMSSTLSSTAPDPNSGDAKSKEIQDLKGAISNLTQRLENLSKGTNSNKTLSPVFMSKEQKRELAPMSKNYKKTLHDEVVHILNNINLSLQFDVSKTYSN